MLIVTALACRHGGARRWCRRGAVAVRVTAVLLALTSAAAAADDAVPALAHWHHAAWSGDSGPPAAGIRRLARTPDGYLWLGAYGGLLRFDGVRFTRIDAQRTPALASRRNGEFHPRLVDREGTLWIARPDGALVTYRDGEFRVAIEPGHDAGTEMAEDGDGRLWLFGEPGRTLHRVTAGGAIDAAPVPGLPVDAKVTAVVRDRVQGLWIGTEAHGLWHTAGHRATRQPAAPSARTPDEVRPLLQSGDGTVWAIGVGLGTGLHRLVEGRWIRVVPPGPGEGLVRGRAVVEDEQGAVWIAGGGTGLLRWDGQRLEQYSTAEGLSDVNAHDVLVDGEGSVWVTTDAGLDRLRPAFFMTVRAAHGLPFESSQRLVEDAEGVLWGLGSPDRRLYRLSGGPVAGQPGPLTAVPQPLPAGDTYDLLGAASGGGVWIGPHRGGLLRAGRGGAVPFGDRGSYPIERIVGAVEAPDGAVWTVFDGPGFGRVRQGRYGAIDLPGSGVRTAPAIALDDTGSVWAAAADAPFVYRLRGDTIVARLDDGQGVPGIVRDLALESGDTLWGITEREVVRLTPAGASAVPVPVLDTLLAARPHLAVARGFLWIGSEAGIARLALADLHAAAASGSAVPDPVVFGPLDGMPVARTSSGSRKPITQTRDGRLWFSTPAGFSIASAAGVPPNPVAPRVIVEEVQIGGAPVPLAPEIRVPPNPGRLTIRVTATGLRMPERVRIQYRIEGVDGDWVDAGPDRSVSYAPLRPGHYTFRARAWNEDGVAADRDAVLALRVMPRWYQTPWFTAAVLGLVTAAGAGLAWRVQRVQARRAAARAQERFEATLSERTRIARELHDSLLQGFTGVTLHLAALEQRLRQSPHDVSDALAGILGIADRSLRETREAVWDMRSRTAGGTGLAETLREVAATTLQGTSIGLRHAVTGSERALPAPSEMALLRVAREAVTNAVRHAAPSLVEIALHYEPGQVRLVLYDNGRGAAPERLESAAAQGHWGVAGMRERVRRAGGSLELATAPGAGTRITVILPVPPAQDR